FIGKTILTVVIILVLAIVAALIFMVCLFGLTRRLGPRLGPLIHIEWTGPPALAGIPFGANSLGFAGALPQAMPLAPERYDRTGSEPRPHAGADTAKRYDPGPTFEDQRRLQEEQAGRRGQAVLQHLFEENLEMHAKIGLANE